MGYRDDGGMNPATEHIDEAEAATRHLLAQWGEPAPVAPPPVLTARVMAALPEAGPGAPPRRFAGIRRGAAALVGAALIALIALGGWGVFVDSSIPAVLIGDASGGPSRMALIATLATKPLLNVGSSIALLLPLCLGVALFGAWLWWRIVRTTPLVAPYETENYR
jgi:hypothetical protein